MQKRIFPTHGSDTAHAMWAGSLVALVLVIGIIVGSRGLRDFDPALVSYAGASVFAAFGIGYRYAMWLRRPPTRLYWVRGRELFLEPKHLGRNVIHLVKLLWNNIVLQRFIEKRSHQRWAAHMLLAWGCLLAAAVTFPLSFGWVRFESAPDNQDIYRALVFGIHAGTFPHASLIGTLAFNVLDISAVMVLGGVFIAMWRRSRDHGAMSVQQFPSDMMPLIMLFAISVTGLFLTVSTHLMHGVHYGFLSQVHAVVVILTLLYLPFGKFFHIFQRPAQLGLAYYKQAGAAGPQAKCMRCGQEFGSQLHVSDLKDVQEALGIHYAMANGSHYQDVCPQCRRKNLALVQDSLWKASPVNITPVTKGHV